MFLPQEENLHLQTDDLHASAHMALQGINKSLSDTPADHGTLDSS